MKYKFDEPIPLYDGSYKCIVDWWKFYKKCLKELSMAKLLDDIPKIFIYEQVVKIVKRDGIR